MNDLKRIQEVSERVMMVDGVENPIMTESKGYNFSVKELNYRENINTMFTVVRENEDREKSDIRLNALRRFYYGNLFIWFKFIHMDETWGIPNDTVESDIELLEEIKELREVC